MNVPDPNSSSIAIAFFGIRKQQLLRVRLLASWRHQAQSREQREDALSHPETNIPDLKKGAGQTNSLDVRTVGNKATLFVNGTQVAEFNGKAPDGGGLVGVETYSPKTGGETEARLHYAMVGKRVKFNAGAAIPVEHGSDHVRLTRDSA
jgi:hypothetical protein